MSPITYLRSSVISMSDVRSMFSKTSAKKCKLNSPSETSDSQIKSDASFDQESEVKL